MATITDPRSRDIPDWLDSRSPWILGPSWLLSAVVHVAFAWLVWQMAQTPGCQARRGEQISDGGREVGIFVREPGDNDPRAPGASPPQPAGSDSPLAAVAASSESPTNALTHSPVPLALPSSTLPRAPIGIGPPPAFATQAAAAAGGPLVKNAGPSGRGDLGPGRGDQAGSGSGNGTSMYGIAAKGKRFVYVIDRSSSMSDVLLSAKGELMASLRRLDEGQEFQVIFFNNEPRQLKTRFALFRGTEADRQVVEDQLGGFSAANGTNRPRALEEALKIRPDVIYFLTDSEDPMTAAELEDVRRHSRGGVQINCVEFGIGPAVTGADGKPARNFLHKLAEQSGGGYAYFNIARTPNR